MGTTTTPRTLIIACGALARELLAITELDGLEGLTVECLPAELHNRPQEIPEAVRTRVRRAEGYDRVLVGYADCGTGGRLDAVCEEEGVDRLPGAHCYEFFATGPRFAEIQDHELGSFYLTDFLVRHFDRLVRQGLGLDRRPELRSSYFGNYTRLVYLAQTDDEDLRARAAEAAERLGLTLTVVATGYGELRTEVAEFASTPVSLQERGR